MVDRSKSPQLPNRAAVADYIGALSSELALIARKNGLDVIGYLLDMVRLEAENTARMNGGSRGKAGPDFSAPD